jgi:hypothetical protein
MGSGTPEEEERRMMGKTTQRPEDEIRQQADGLVTALARLPGTNEASRLLDTLASTQRALADNYDRLAAAHERSAIAELRTEFADPRIPDNPSWLAAAVALRTAAQLARFSAHQLDEAHRDNEVAVWFDDIEQDV